MLENKARQVTQTNNKARSVYQEGPSCLNVNHSENSSAHEIHVLYRKTFQIVIIGSHVKYQNPSLGMFVANDVPVSN